MNAEEMYAEIILDYYRNPRNKGPLSNATISSKDVNPACGDEVTMHLAINNATITNITFEGSGCAISQAAASLLTEDMKGKKLPAVKQYTKQELLNLLGIPISPARIKCALLGLKVLKMAVYQQLGEHAEEFDLNGGLQ